MHLFNSIHGHSIGIRRKELINSESTFIVLLLIPKFNFSKPWVKNQGIQPHVECMPPCGCIARLYRRHLVDREFLHRNGSIKIGLYWWFGDDKRNWGGNVCFCSGFSRFSFYSEVFLPRGSESWVLEIYGWNFINGPPNLNRQRVKLTNSLKCTSVQKYWIFAPAANIYDASIFIWKFLMNG